MPIRTNLQSKLLITPKLLLDSTLLLPKNKNKKIIIVFSIIFKSCFLAMLLQYNICEIINMNDPLSTGKPSLFLV